MNASNKSPEMESFITKLTGKDRKATVNKSLCMFCPTEKLVFRDALSRKEYGISGLCQDCQDKVFCCDDEEGGE